MCERKRESFESLIDRLPLLKLKFVNRWLINELKKSGVTELILKDTIKRIAYCQHAIKIKSRCKV